MWEGRGQGLNKLLGVEEAPKGLCLVSIRASGGHTVQGLILYCRMKQA